MLILTEKPSVAKDFAKALAAHILRLKNATKKLMGQFILQTVSDIFLS